MIRRLQQQQSLSSSSRLTSMNRNAQDPAREDDDGSAVLAVPSDTNSLTSDYSTTSSMAPPAASVCLDLPPTTSSDYASTEEPSPCGEQNALTAPVTEVKSKEDDVKSTVSASSIQDTMSRIGRKIRFRAKKDTPTQRRHNGTLRRHTLTDLEAVRAALGEEDHVGDDGIAAGNESGGKSRMTRLTRWLKHSFRSSSPDVRGVVELNGSTRSPRGDVEVL
jgi:hypothetical protein